jgi:hypothetical protein
VFGRASETVGAGTCSLGPAVVYGFHIGDVHKAKFTLDQIEKKFSAIPDTMHRLAEIKSHLAARFVSLRIARRSALELDMQPAGLEPATLWSEIKMYLARKMLELTEEWLRSG